MNDTDPETSPAKHEVAEANAMLIQESLESEPPTADQIYRAWRAMLALPFQLYHVPHHVPRRIVDFSIKGFIRLGTRNTVEKPHKGLTAYLGGEVYVKVKDLCKGRVGRVLLSDFYKVQQGEQHSALQTLVEMVDREYTGFGFEDQDFTVEATISSHAVGVATNLCHIRHWATTTALEVPLNVLPSTWAGIAVMEATAEANCNAINRWL